MKLKKSLKSSVFVIYIISYFTLSILLIGIIGVFIYTNSTKQLEKEIVQEKAKRLEYVSELIETSVFEPLYSITSRTALDLNENYNPYFNIIQKPAGKNIYPIFVEIQNLKKVVDSNTAIESITMYYLRADAIISSKAFKEDAHMFVENEFIDWLDNQSEDLENRWIYRNVYRDSFDTDKSVDVITYIRNYPLMSKDEAVEAYVYTNAYISEIRKTLNSVVFQEKEKILLVDKVNEHVITDSGFKSEENELFASMEGEKGYVITDFGYGLSVVTWQLSSVDGWYYVIITPVDDFYNFSQSVKKTIIIACLATLVLSIILSYILSKGMYNPIKKLKNKILPNDQSPKNDFKKINDTIDDLNSKISALTVLMNNNNITRFLYGTDLPYEEELPASFTQYKYFKIVVLKAKTRDKLNTIKDFFEELLNSNLGKNFVVNSVMRPRDNCEIIYIINGGNEIDNVGELKNIIGAAFDAYVGIGVKVDSIYELNVSLESAQTALKYIYAEPENKVFDSYEFSSDTRVRANIKFDYHKFSNNLISGNMEAIKKELTDIAANVRKNKYTYSSLEKIVFRLLAAMNDFLSSINREDELKEPNLFKWYLEHDLTFYQSLEWIQNLCKRIITMNKDRDESVNKAFEKIRSYVEEHLDEDLSLDKMASLSCFSTSYISLNFKRIFGIGFSKYVYNSRLEKAASYLKETDMSISKIIKKVGFNSLPYFTTKFKNKFGVTPNEYRKANRRL